MRFNVVSFLIFVLSSNSFSQTIGCSEDLFPVRDAGKKQYGYVNIFGTWKIPAFYDIAREFTEGIAVVNRKSKFGIISCEGKVILTCDYDDILDFVNGYAWVKKGALWGMVDRSGKFVLECKYDKVQNVSKFNDLAWLKTNGKWGLFDKEKISFVHVPQFDDYLQLSHDFSLVEINGKKGMINHTDKNYILEAEYDAMEKFAPYLFSFAKGDLLGVVRDNGKAVLPLEYSSVKNLGQTLFAAEKNGKYGVWDVWGRTIVPLVLDSIGAFSSDLAVFKKDDSYGYITSRGKIVLGKFEYASSFVNDVAKVKDSLGSYLIDPNGKKISAVSDSIQLFKSYYVAQTSEEEFQIHQYKNKNSSKILFKGVDGGSIEKIRVLTNEGVRFYDLVKNDFANNLVFDNVSVWTDNYFAVTKGDKVGVLDTNLNLLIKAEYDNEINYSVFGYYFFGVFDGDKEAIFDMKGKQLTDFYLYVSVLNKNQFIVYDGTSFGVVSDKKQEVIPMKYQKLERLGDDLEKYAYPLLVKKDSKYGLLSEANTFILPIKYKNIAYLGFGNYSVIDKKGQQLVYNYKGELIFSKVDFLVVSATSTGQYVVQKNNKLGLVDNSGLAKSDFNYQSFYPFQGNYCIVSEDNKYGILGKSGKLKEDTIYTNVTQKADGSFVLSRGINTVTLTKEGEIIKEEE